MSQIAPASAGHYVSADYFKTLGIPLLVGSNPDPSGSDRVVLL